MERNTLTNYPLPVFHDILTESVKEMKLQWTWLAVWSLLSTSGIYLPGIQQLSVSANGYTKLLANSSPGCESKSLPSFSFLKFLWMILYISILFEQNHWEIFNPFMIFLTNSFKCKIHQIHCLQLHQNVNNLCNEIMVFKIFYFRLFFIFNIFWNVNF